MSLMICTKSRFYTHVSVFYFVLSALKEANYIISLLKQDVILMLHFVRKMEQREMEIYWDRKLALLDYLEDLVPNIKGYRKPKTPKQLESFETRCASKRMQNIMAQNHQE